MTPITCTCKSRFTGVIPNHSPKPAPDHRRPHGETRDRRGVGVVRYFSCWGGQFVRHQQDNLHRQLLDIML
jgi:hypothetical protein